MPDTVNLGTVYPTDYTGPREPVNINAQIDQFQQQNLSPSDIFAAARTLPQTVGGITGLGSMIPGLGSIPLPTKKLNDLLAIPDILKQGTNGTWQSALYGADMNAHHPKFKFLFKVLFVGFGVQEFYRYVHRCDKPRVRINHQDVNYYNFRTRVQTSTTYDPLTMSFLDDISNTVNTFFTEYMKTRTGTANGKYGIHEGFGAASSTLPYANGYSDGRRIIIEQIFGNGTQSNRFTFINPRIESFDFDELNMEDSNGNMVNMTFTYDAFTSETVSSQTLYSWGNTDLLRGGGTSGTPNAGDSSGAGLAPQSSANNGSIGDFNLKSYQPDLILKNAAGGVDLLNMTKSVLGGNPVSMIERGVFNAAGVVGSGASTLMTNIGNSISNVFNGNNLKFPAYDPGTTQVGNRMGEGLQQWAIKANQEAADAGLTPPTDAEVQDFRLRHETTLE